MQAPIPAKVYPMKMLLVEDDPTIAHELTLRWQQRGWQLRWVATLADARTALAQPGLFDLVLLDRKSVG